MATATVVSLTPSNVLVSVGARLLPTKCALANKRILFLSPPHILPSTLAFSPSLPLITKATLPRNLTIRAARTESKGVSLGSRAPNFQLPEPLTGKTWKLDDFESYPALLVMFICNHCPFVIHLKKDIVKLSNFYMRKGLGVIAISSNSVATHPQDGPEFMAEEANLFKYPFPYLYDETQDVVRAFGAVCTPEFFLFKKDGRRPFELVYHGQFDDSRPSNNVPVTGRDLSMAIDCVLSGQTLSSLSKSRIIICKSKLSFEGHILFDIRGLYHPACGVSWSNGKRIFNGVFSRSAVSMNAYMSNSNARLLVQCEYSQLRLKEFSESDF
ncbi:Alkyl hydroperoxide reductase subunit C/ Thiol specific antioxidant [Macleaya cordata]|uniref:glutaredoxin-dependent peroxiredoxin n=1 Tax=Macleaya cordata TaxID=56857 RepID=A0A200R0B3_MACCD|nr:Alkyl hydroperoxide reductase subunit C/ Thiol specific antioxidant [Macleaya cordata]